MGWNSGYKVMESTVVALYDAGVLTAEILDKTMDPYKGTDCDSGGSRDLKAADGLEVEEIICKIMKPDKYQDAVDNPVYYENEPHEWDSNEKAYELFYSIWRDLWKIW